MYCPLEIRNDNSHQQPTSADCAVCSAMRTTSSTETRRVIDVTGFADLDGGYFSLETQFTNIPYAAVVVSVMLL